ncbi:outer membrane beta-barrel protein [Shewanella pneumatophori]|uniref:Porin family protein n=1 Tax=Shewanella pneumatophori TaxID=314092 RepID=A0A9X1ZAL8_9GAMM|nr:outer membrane beta-barrel protein [Shewanella pneumatophori]MCL1138729.1 porin family protein [Shewanella pneumatophori]
MKPSIAVLMTSLCALPATAEVYVAPFAGYSFAASEFDISNSASADTGQGKIAESENYGVMLGITTKDPGSVYLLYSHQATDLKGAGNFSPEIITSMDVDYFHVGGTLYFPTQVLNPYVTTSLGLTSMRPGGGYSTETRFSMAIGGGFEYQVTQSLALFAEVKGYATFVNADNALFCDGSGCIWNIQSDIMWQGQANIGASLKF